LPVLKLNSIRKFNTGIYPYSVMVSVFAPIDTSNFSLPLKISFSSQEWCGHVYQQLNLKEQRYRLTQHSYFEAEADQMFTLAQGIPEDAIWTGIRIAPQNLPQGEFQLIPGTFYARMRHQRLKPQLVHAALSATDQQSMEGNRLVQYKINFMETQRELTIWFEAEFPYRIQQWADTHAGMAHRGTTPLTTRAERTHSIMLDYWNRNQPPDQHWLKSLGL
jgi:hypothetical protein